MHVLPGLTVKVVGRTLPKDILSTARPPALPRFFPLEGAGEGSQRPVPESNEAALAPDSNHKDKRATAHRHRGTEPVLPKTCGTLLVRNGKSKKKKKEDILFVVVFKGRQSKSYWTGSWGHSGIGF